MNDDQRRAVPGFGPARPPDPRYPGERTVGRIRRRQAVFNLILCGSLALALGISLLVDDRHLVVLGFPLAIAGCYWYWRHDVAARQRAVARAEETDLHP